MGIAPLDIVQRMIQRIGNCDSKLDFGWGHPFLAADRTAFPYINEWARAAWKGGEVKGADIWGDQASEVSANAQVWKVVGGADKGGIVVREGEAVSSKSGQIEQRLATGALVEELERKGERLRYKLLKGEGPQEGWVSITLKENKVLLVKTDEKPLGLYNPQGE